MPPPNLDYRDALLIVDLQNDFCPGGALPVTQFEGVLETTREWLNAAQDGGAIVVASRDWHPLDHASFQPQGGRWPVHCVQNTPGAAFHNDLSLPASTRIIDKGRDPARDQLSAFERSGLDERLADAGITRIFVAGVAQEVCVRAAVLDALRAGFEVHVIAAATAPIDSAAGRAALEEMQAAGAILEEND